LTTTNRPDSTYNQDSLQSLFYKQDIPENIFDILFNHSLPSPSNFQSNHDQTRAEKNEIYQLLWQIIKTNRTKQTSTEKWPPDSIRYPSIIIRLRRARFPSSETDKFLANCTKYSMGEFILYIYIFVYIKLTSFFSK
jgi:hypothetical protein